jgi:hypothetical protein
MGTPPTRTPPTPRHSPPVELALLSALEHDSHLFLRYGVLGGR